MIGCGQSLDHKAALGQGSGTVRRRKEERGGEERKKEKAFTCIMKVKLLYKNGKIQKKRERERRREGGREAREFPPPQDSADQG